MEVTYHNRQETVNEYEYRPGPNWYRLLTFSDVQTNVSRRNIFPSEMLVAWLVPELFFVELALNDGVWP